MNDQGRVLVIRRQAHDQVLAGYWDVPGGTLEDGEDPAVGVAREVQEETGLDIYEPRLFNFTSNVDTGKNKQFVRLIFRAKNTGGTVQLNPEEHDDFQWIDPVNPPALNYVDYLPACLTLLAG